MVTTHHSGLIRKCSLQWLVHPIVDIECLTILRREQFGERLIQCHFCHDALEN